MYVMNCTKQSVHLLCNWIHALLLERVTKGPLEVLFFQTYQLTNEQNPVNI